MDELNFEMQPIDEADSKQSILRKKTQQKRRWLLAALAALVLALGALFLTYQWSLRPVSSLSNDKQALEIEPGMAPQQIANLLEDEQLIRSALAFRIYIKLHGVENQLQAGTYQLSPSESVAEIVKMLNEGSEAQTFEVTILPGSNLNHIKEVLQKAGFSSAEIDVALTKDYDLPVLDTKPANADLEGYLFAETHQFKRGVSADVVIEMFLGSLDQFVSENNLTAAYKKRGLTLFEGLTLASIVEKESAGGDQRPIAQVFLLRLKRNMRLDADPTYQYAADKLNVPRDIGLDSPYNTRRHKGLPPGPIAVSGPEALKAVAEPAAGSYLYFVHGDDNRIHLAKTEAEHEQNVANFCHEKCSVM